MLQITRVLQMPIRLQMLSKSIGKMGAPVNAQDNPRYLQQFQKWQISKSNLLVLSRLAHPCRMSQTESSTTTIGAIVVWSLCTLSTLTICLSNHSEQRL